MRVELDVVVCGEALVVLIAHPDAHHCTDGNGGSLDGEGVHVPLLVHWQGAVVQGKQPTNAHHHGVHLAHVRSPGIVVELQVHCSTRSLAERFRRPGARRCLSMGLRVKSLALASARVP